MIASLENPALNENSEVSMFDRRTVMKAAVVAGLTAPFLAACDQKAGTQKKGFPYHFRPK